MFRIKVIKSTGETIINKLGTEVDFRNLADIFMIDRITRYDGMAEIYLING